ncbi:MAG: helix-turn-helix transcriptional regulator [Planctomycetes bacterium]|nr:helix-turn-helix transcriptional regulator [Planctomycetota bacterium]
MRPIPTDNQLPDRVLIVSSPVASAEHWDELQDHCEVVRAKVNDMGSLAGLSERELEVLALIGEGLSTTKIARRLHRTVKTVEWHRAAIGRKLGVTNRVEVAHIAIRAGLAHFLA